MYQYLGFAVIIKFIAYKILVVERDFNFFRFSSFGFQDLCVVAVLVAIVRRNRGSPTRQPDNGDPSFSCLVNSMNRLCVRTGRERNIP